MRDGRGGGERRPDGALVDQGASRLEAAAQERVRRRPDADARLRRLGEDRRRIRPRRGQRLLGVDVLASGDRGPRDGRVRGRRREDEDDVDGRVGQELFQGDGREAPASRKGGGPVGVEVGAGRELDRRERCGAR
jgi:hypothetical protein